MKIVQLIKKLNNSELAKDNVHEYYVHIPSDLDVSDIFPECDRAIIFKDKASGEFYRSTRANAGIRLTSPRNGERRICGLGPYYRNNSLNAGDEILFEKRTYADKSEFYISCRKLTDTIVLRKTEYGFEVLTPETMNLLDSYVVEVKSQEKLRFELHCARPRRNDSPTPTNYYNIYVGEDFLPEEYSCRDLIEIEIRNKTAIIRRSDFIWKTYSFTQED